MNVETQSVDLTDSEFEQACSQPGCCQPATHAQWCAHNTHCESGYAVTCAHHAAAVEKFWRDLVDEKAECRCGWTVSGELSDNYRAIQL